MLAVFVFIEDKAERADKDIDETALLLALLWAISLFIMLVRFWNPSLGASCP